MSVENDWSGLGYNPAPGHAGTVERLGRSLGRVAERLLSVHETLVKVQKGKGEWSGEAAEAFAKNLGPLPKYLQDAGDSITHAKGALDAWWQELNTNQPKAAQLETRARAARQAQSEAAVAHEKANANPDLRLAGTVFKDDARLADAQRRYDTANAELAAARAKLENARAGLEDILKAANSLADEHERVAKNKADAIRAAADSKAPPEPGFFSKVGDWFKDNADWITVAASVVGVAAIFFPGLAIVAFALSAVALASHGAKYGKEGLWPPGRDKIGNYLTLGGDALGMIPGVGAAAKGIRAGVGAARGAKGANAASKVGIAIKESAKRTNYAAKATDPSNPLITKPVEAVAARLGASSANAQRIADGVQAATTLGLTAPTAIAAAHPTDSTASAANYGTGAANVLTGQGMAKGGGKTGVIGSVAALGSAFGLGGWAFGG